MLLLEIKENAGWVLSQWNLTYAVGWEQICKAVYFMFDYYDNTEILVDDKLIDLSSKEEIIKIDESGSMTIRGVSKIMKVPLMITFFNQTSAVNVNVAQVNEEFKTVDYQKFNFSLCQYMDSVELSMHR
ncbi:MAG: hypothetical protein PT934_06515 [Peptoniphilaceae bacterium]|uniref:hypothetical protein n=1 Tax=Parvimonas sp. TaxID=1944660 RepID=UPI0025E3C1F5|nr:hypothetical protein [Parvimonas sp.]MCI5997350.1 hypothetical protein [Parvimonas sp.]MDD7765405.1 hypothetical protein [Peptoniphilaceae bacterium]MDY3050671.1 hypothetical protein [Parvimonas sp.]